MFQNSSFFAGSFRTILFFADSRENIGFSLAESSFFCLSQQKLKELVKRSAFSNHVNRPIFANFERCAVSVKISLWLFKFRAVRVLINNKV